MACDCAKAEWIVKKIYPTDYPHVLCLVECKGCGKSAGVFDPALPPQSPNKWLVDTLATLCTAVKKIAEKLDVEVKI